jgi:hypothetical protein
MAFSQNPITGYAGVSDPHIRVFNDTVFLYSGHDTDPHDKTWVMKDWRVFSTTDLMHWKLRTTIRPEDNYMGTNTDCWATDAATKNGKYYFYFSDEKRSVGVMVSNSPAGPFKDALGKPLIAPMNDPTAFIDDDQAKTPYLIYGNKEMGGGYHIAKLNNDMISLAETPKLIVINGKEWERTPQFMDKNYLFKYKDTYYISWGRGYATSKNIYGPYESVGRFGEGQGLNTLAHSSFFWWKGQFYQVWCRYLDMAYKFRETIITFCHMNEKGEAITDINFLDQHFSNGVGQYNASWPKIEAEWYSGISGDIHKKGNLKDGIVLADIKNANWIRFANVTFDKELKKLVVKELFSGKNGLVEIRTDSPKGNLLGTVKLTPAEGFQEVSCQLKGFVGKKDVFLVFKGTEESTLQLDWFKFEE